MTRLSVICALLVVMVSTLAVAGPASAEVEPGNIAAATIQTAYPTQPGVSYSGAFQPDTAFGYHDLDYLAFAVANPGETLEFTLQNSTQGVNPAPYEWCPVYLSLLNPSNTLVADGAGTIATCDDTEVFDWTFQAPGIYSMVLESNGDMPAGDPRYVVSYRIVSPGTSSSGHPGLPSSGAPQAPLVRSLHVANHQHGRAVIAKLNLRHGAALSASLRMSGRAIVGISRSWLRAGSHKLVIRIPAAYAKKLKRSGLRLSVGISVQDPSGHRDTFNRYVHLSA